jgi:hypothetical protein
MYRDFNCFIIGDAHAALVLLRPPPRLSVLKTASMESMDARMTNIVIISMYYP